MVAMRLASEQQLSNCFSSVGPSCHELGSSPSVEALMTLLWAIHVIEKERENTLPKLDVAMDEEQEAEFAFRPSTIKRREREVSYVKHGRRGPMAGSGRSKKSLGDWRPAFDGCPHGR